MFWCKFFSDNSNHCGDSRYCKQVNKKNNKTIPLAFHARGCIIIHTLVIKSFACLIFFLIFICNFFSNVFFFLKIFCYYYQRVKQFGSRLGPTFTNVGPNLCPNCLQRLSTNDASRQLANVTYFICVRVFHIYFDT